MRLLAKCFLLLVGTLIYHQCGQTKHYQGKLRAACAAKGGKLTLSNLCINLSWAHEPTDARSRTPTATGFLISDYVSLP